MGRHRPDPRGHARILIAVLAVMLVLVLLVVGGVALFGALSSDSAAPSSMMESPATGTSVAAPQSRTASHPSRSIAARQTLMIRVTGGPTKVYVTVSGNTSQVLEDGVLNTGDIREYNEAPLDAVVADGGAVEVYIHGRRQPKRTSGQRAQWHIAAP